MSGKKKIINDPVYGFITFRHELLLQLADHPIFQRMRRIAQLGLSHLVYPGALHNRFQHAIGAMHLAQIAIDELRHKGQMITTNEEIGLLAAVLLHDIGHGPFSHALENSIVHNLHHEVISSFIMQKLNEEFNGKLDTAIRIFNQDYPKKFLQQLVSSQLDMDRLDYLARDSFFSGVIEGQVGSERIIKMLDVANDELVVEEKGIYSIEKFIVARRFMYWQVYLHKTVLSAEFMLVNALRRAKHLAEKGVEVFASPSLRFFLYNKISEQEFLHDPEVVKHFINLDDFDIANALKVWQSHTDKVLSDLSFRLNNRKLFKIELQKNPFEEKYIQSQLLRIAEAYNLNPEESSYFVIHDRVYNHAYDSASNAIKIKMKDGTILDVQEASDQLHMAALTTNVEKWFLAYAK